MYHQLRQYRKESAVTGEDLTDNSGEPIREFEREGCKKDHPGPEQKTSRWFQDLLKRLTTAESTAPAGRPYSAHSYSPDARHSVTERKITLSTFYRRERSANRPSLRPLKAPSR